MSVNDKTTSVGSWDYLHHCTSDVAATNSTTAITTKPIPIIAIAVMTTASTSTIVLLLQLHFLIHCYNMLVTLHRMLYTLSKILQVKSRRTSI